MEKSLYIVFIIFLIALLSTIILNKPVYANHKCSIIKEYLKKKGHGMDCKIMRVVIWTDTLKRS